MAVRKFRLLTVQLAKAADGKYTVAEGAKYKPISELVELEIKKGNRPGSKFIVTATPKDTDRATIDQYIVNSYRGTVTGKNRPAYVLTYQPAGAAPTESSLVCALFSKKYPEGGEAFVGRKDNIRFYLTELNEDGTSKSQKKKS